LNKIQVNFDEIPIQITAVSAMILLNVAEVNDEERKNRVSTFFVRILYNLAS